MAPRATTKVQWTVEEKRRLLDYIRNCKAKNQKATSVDFVQNVINSLDKAQAARSTMQIVREETSAMVKNAKLDEKHSSTTLWKSGPEILDLNHPYLRGVYTAKVIAEISDAAQAGPSNARKRKPEESMDGQRKSKRNRNGPLTEISDSELSSLEEIEEPHQPTILALSKLHRKRKTTQSVDTQRKPKRTKRNMPTEASGSGGSDEEGSVAETISTKTDPSRQRNKRGREADLFVPEKRPSKKQKTVNIDNRIRTRRQSAPAQTGASSESSGQSYDSSEANEVDERRVVKLKFTMGGPPKSSQIDEDRSVAASEEDHGERDQDTQSDTEDDDLAEATFLVANNHVRPLQADESSLNTSETGATHARVQNPTRARDQIGQATSDQGLLSNTDEEESDRVLEIPRDYYEGLLLGSPLSSHMADDLHEIYNLIMTAVLDHLKALQIDEDQPVLIKDRAWDDDLAQLMDTVFGHHITPEQLAKDFTTIQSARTLPLHVLLRSLSAAAVLNWAFKPQPLGYVNESRSRDARTINALKRVLTNRFDDGVTAQIFFEARQNAIQEEVLPEIDTRAGIFAHRLFMALGPFFQSTQLSHYSYVSDPFHLRPLSKSYLAIKAMTGNVLPPTRRVQSQPETDAHEKPLPGSTGFERGLVEVFKNALQTRYKWEQSHDGWYEYYFPTFKSQFQQGYYYNEEYSLKDSTSVVRVSSEFIDRVFVATMFGVNVRVRKRWTAEFTQSEMMSKPVVFNLD